MSSSLNFCFGYKYRKYMVKLKFIILALTILILYFDINLYAKDNVFGLEVSPGSLCSCYTALFYDNDSRVEWGRYDKKNSIPFGIFFANQLLALEYKKLANDRSHYGKISLANNSLFCTSVLRYDKNLHIDDFTRDGEHLETEYSDLQYEEASHFNSQFEIGYLIKFNSEIFQNFSYRALYFQTESPSPGFAIGLPLSIYYNYSYLKSDQNLIPEDEQKYFGKYASFSGSVMNSAGIKFAPIFMYTWKNLFCSLGFDFNFLNYSYGEINFDDDQRVMEFQLIETDSFLFPYFLSLGYTGGGTILLLSVDTDDYYSVHLDDATYYELSIDITLKAGYRF